ncbi:MAG: sulfatase-like hydrolase/transferase, partial [Candidatus Omnitrophota bacterium]|nr:sulfatase-like hydrolase/transferase [Candidatus Omnitrophota bacterium]
MKIKRRYIITFFAVLIAGAFFAARCGVNKKVKTDKPLNILLITIDTLRADHLGCYGNNRIKTPNIDNLAREGVRFKNVVCQAPLTGPSHASILTGLYPHTHGVRINGYPLRDSVLTIA